MWVRVSIGFTNDNNEVVIDRVYDEDGDVSKTLIRGIGEHWYYSLDRMPEDEFRTLISRRIADDVKLKILNDYVNPLPEFTFHSVIDGN